MDSGLLVFTAATLFLMFIWFGFVGCSSFGAAESIRAEYGDIVRNSPGFAAHWDLNESSGDIAYVTGPLAPSCHGGYVGGVTLGDAGVLSKDSSDHAVSLDGSSAFVEVKYDARLNVVDRLKFSVDLWVKPTPGSGQSTQVVISSHQISGTQHRGYEIALLFPAGQSHPTVRGRVYSANAPASEVTSTVTGGDPAAWRYIGMAYDGEPGTQMLTLFVGLAGDPNPSRSEYQKPRYDAVQRDKSSLRFGAGHQNDGSAGSFFAGSIDHVAFYNDVLDLEAVRERLAVT